jgi:SNF2 family DNA or RNA helicase
MTHIANKYTDPEIRAEFPEEHWEDVLIDMSSEDRKLYNSVRQEIIRDMNDKELYATMMTRLIPLQLVCDNPALLNKSDSTIARTLVAKYKFNDTHCAKLETLKDMLDTIDGKIVIFSMFNDFGSKMLAKYIAAWNHSFVLYDGSAQHKQAAQDKFRENPHVKIFLSSDTGSDSIDLEQATTVINYNMPWNYSTLIQRVNRINRITSEADHVFYYNLITVGTMEERKLKVLEKKRLMEEAIDLPIAEQSEMIAQTSVDDLKWMLS